LGFSLPNRPSARIQPGRKREEVIRARITRACTVPVSPQRGVGSTKEILRGRRRAAARCAMSLVTARKPFVSFRSPCLSPPNTLPCPFGSHIAHHSSIHLRAFDLPAQHNARLPLSGQNMHDLSTPLASRLHARIDLTPAPMDTHLRHLGRARGRATAARGGAAAAGRDRGASPIAGQAHRAAP
jgi:hypothetical protein